MRTMLVAALFGTTLIVSFFVSHSMPSIFTVSDSDLSLSGRLSMNSGSLLDHSRRFIEALWNMLFASV